MRKGGLEPPRRQSLDTKIEGRIINARGLELKTVLVIPLGGLESYRPKSARAGPGPYTCPVSSPTLLFRDQQRSNVDPVWIWYYAAMQIPLVLLLLTLLGSTASAQVKNFTPVT